MRRWSAISVVGMLACAQPQQDGDSSAGSDSTETGETLGESDSESDSESTDGSDSGSESETGELACSGSVELCERPFDEVVFAGTHNSHASSAEGFGQFNTNQVYDVATQLDDGIRVLLMDTYLAEDDSVVLCHGPCNLGQTSHLATLETIVGFLIDNPGELITIIYEDHVDVGDLALDYASAGAEALVYAHPQGSSWPTLGELVEADTRLIVTAENGGPPPAWHHHVWDVAWDTPYGPMDPAELSCALNRGSADNDLFLMNHWVNNDIGLPSPSDAELVNEYDFLLARAQQCEAMWDHPPNFIAVDFYDRGDVVGVVQTLNGL